MYVTSPRWAAEQVKLLHVKNGKKDPILGAIFKALMWTQTTAVGKGTFFPRPRPFSARSKAKRCTAQTHLRLLP